MRGRQRREMLTIEDKSLDLVPQRSRRATPWPSVPRIDDRSTLNGDFPREEVVDHRVDMLATDVPSIPLRSSTRERSSRALNREQRTTMNIRPRSAQRMISSDVIVLPLRRERISRSIDLGPQMPRTISRVNYQIGTSSDTDVLPVPRERRSLLTRNEEKERSASIRPLPLPPPRLTRPFSKRLLRLFTSLCSILCNCSGFSSLIATGTWWRRKSFPLPNNSLVYRSEFSRLNSPSSRHRKERIRRKGFITNCLFTIYRQMRWESSDDHRESHWRQTKKSNLLRESWSRQMNNSLTSVFVS